MKKVITALLIATASPFAFSVGLGYDQSLAGVGGLSLRFATNDYLFSVIGDQQTNSISAIDSNGKSTSTSTTSFALSARLFKKFAEAGALNPYFGIGLDWSNLANGYNPNGNSTTGAQTGSSNGKSPMALEFPMLVDYKINPSMSISTNVGYKIGLANDGNYGIKGSFFGGAGFTVWFDFDVNSRLSSDPQNEQRSKK